MKGKDKHLRSGIITFMIVFMMFGRVCLAEEQAVIMQADTNEADLAIYVKNIENDLSGISVQIGTSESKQVTCQSIEESEFETLILIDNSLSIPQKARGKISEFLDNFIESRAGNEKIAIGVFSRDITYLTDYTSDYNELKNAAAAVSYQNQETYITDMLYELLTEEYMGKSKGVYRRIIMIADGIDNESLGYTTDELNRLIEENTFPIYTIGCATGKNNQELEKLFALSRSSGAEYFLLENEEDTASIANKLSKDRQIVKIVITPDAELMDGSKKTVKINFTAQSVSKEMKMPQQIEQKEVIESTESQEEIVEMTQEEVEELSVEETTVQDYEEALRKDSALTFILYVIIFWIVVIVLCIAIITIKHFKKKRKIETDQTENLMAQRERELKAALANSSIAMDARGQQPIAYIILTDIHSPDRSFRVPFYRNLIIGRNKDACAIALDYDRSVSGRHCEIYAIGNKVMIKDLQSSNGTFVNGNRVFMDTELISGSIITIGGVEMRFELQQTRHVKI